jgi:hypothetical protein
MGSLHGGNGDSWPPEGGGSSDDLPGLPAEWGAISVPDDLSALADEAATVRRELRRAARRARWRRRLHLPPPRPRRRDDDSPAIGVPLLIVSIAVVATMASLFAIAWPTRSRVSPSRPTGAAGTAPAAARSGSAGGAPGTPPATLAGHLPDITVQSADGEPIRVLDLKPLLILLVDECACERLLGDSVSAVRSGNARVTVLALGRATLPSAGQLDARLWLATDAAGAIWNAGGLVSTRGHGAAMLVDGDGLIRRTLPLVTSVEDFRAELAGLR